MAQILKRGWGRTNSLLIVTALCAVESTGLVQGGIENSKIQILIKICRYFKNKICCYFKTCVMNPEAFKIIYQDAPRKPTYV